MQSTTDEQNQLPAYIFLFFHYLFHSDVCQNTDEKTASTSVSSQLKVVKVLWVVATHLNLWVLNWH